MKPMINITKCNGLFIPVNFYISLVMVLGFSLQSSAAPITQVPAISLRVHAHPALAASVYQDFYRIAEHEAKSVIFPAPAAKETVLVLRLQDYQYQQQVQTYLSQTLYGERFARLTVKAQAELYYHGEAIWRRTRQLQWERAHTEPDHQMLGQSILQPYLQIRQGALAHRLPPEDQLRQSAFYKLTRQLYGEAQLFFKHSRNNQQELIDEVKVRE